MADWITEKELCEWLKIERMTAYRWRKQGLPHIGSRKSIRYNKTEVEKRLRENKKTKEARSSLVARRTSSHHQPSEEG